MNASSEFLLAQTRLAMLEAAGIKPDDLRRTVRAHRKLLKAETTKYFAHEGKVTDSRTEPDHDARARAIDMFYDLAGVKAPRAQAAPAQQGVAIEIGADGVVRIVIASSSAPLPVGSGHADG